MEQGLLFAQWLSLPTGGQICPRTVGAEAPRPISELGCEGAGELRWGWSTPAGRGATKCSSASAVLPRACCAVSPVTQAYKAFGSWHCSRSLLKHRHPALVPSGGRSHKASAASLKSGILSTAVAPLDLRWPLCARPYGTQPTLTLSLRPDLSQAGSCPLGCPGVLSLQSRQWWGDPSQWQGRAQFLPLHMGSPRVLPQSLQR